MYKIEAILSYKREIPVYLDDDHLFCMHRNYLGEIDIPCDSSKYETK